MSMAVLADEHQYGVTEKQQETQRFQVSEQKTALGNMQGSAWVNPRFREKWPHEAHLHNILGLRHKVHCAGMVVLEIGSMGPADKPRAKCIAGPQTNV